MDSAIAKVTKFSCACGTTQLMDVKCLYSLGRGYCLLGLLVDKLTLAVCRGVLGKDGRRKACAEGAQCQDYYQKEKPTIFDANHQHWKGEEEWVTGYGS